MHNDTYYIRLEKTYNYTLSSALCVFFTTNKGILSLTHIMDLKQNFLKYFWFVTEIMKPTAVHVSSSPCLLPPSVLALIFTP